MEQCRGYLHRLPCAPEQWCCATKRRAEDNSQVLERRQTDSTQCRGHQLGPERNDDNFEQVQLNPAQYENDTLPWVGASSAVITFIVVVFPAPLWPTHGSVNIMRSFLFKKYSAEIYPGDQTLLLTALQMTCSSQQDWPLLDFRHLFRTFSNPRTFCTFCVDPTCRRTQLICK